MIKLIVGLGNPGKKYALTRHNLGFLAVDALAEASQVSFKEQSSFEGYLAKRNDGVLLLKPTTYMNLSGQSVRRVSDYFKVTPSETVIVCDDIALPYGMLRLRRGGSSGGHNGLKSIEAHYGTQQYPRLKIGIGDREHGNLADHVLAPLSAKELEALPTLLRTCTEVLEELINGNFTQVMNTVNTKLKGETHE